MTIKEFTNLKESINLLRFIQRKPKCTHQDIATGLKISKSSVKRLIRKVQNLGVIIENKGTKRTPEYLITSWGFINKDEIDTEDLSNTPKNYKGEVAMENGNANL